MDPIQKNIFKHTEINSSESDRFQAFPLLSKTPKTASTSKLNKTSNLKTQNSWRNSSKISLVSPKGSSPSKFESLLSRVTNDLEMPSTRSASHIMSWDLDGNLKKEIGSLQKIIEFKQKTFNQVHHEAQTKENILQKLKFELSALAKENVNEPKSVLNKRILEYNEILRALNNENYYIETLNYMISQRKIQVLKQEPPVREIKENLIVKKLEIAKIENEIDKFHKEYCEISKNIENIDKEIIGIENTQKEIYNVNLNSLKQKKNLKDILKKEYKINSMIQNQEKYEKMIKQLEPILEGVENEEKYVAKQSHFLQDREYYERKILKISEVASINQVEEIFENYETLKDHTKMLELTANQYTHKIDSLASERNKMMAELNEIILNHEDERKLNPKEFERIENNLREKNKIIDENERILNNLGGVMGKICGSVTRLSVQLLGYATTVDVKPRNVKKYFESCVDKLEDRLNFIFSRKLSQAEIGYLSKKFPGLMGLYEEKRKKNNETKVLEL